MISMTWPQYLRRECGFRGATVSLSEQEAEVLAIMLIRSPRPSRLSDFFDALWGDDPEGGPIRPEDGLGAIIMRLRAKLPGSIGGRHGFGWFINEEKTMADDTKSKLTALAEALPDDTRAALVITSNENGEVSIHGVNATLPHLLQMVGIATTRVGANLTPTPAKAA